MEMRSGGVLSGVSWDDFNEIFGYTKKDTPTMSFFLRNNSEEKLCKIKKDLSMFKSFKADITATTKSGIPITITTCGVTPEENGTIYSVSYLTA